jgi:hypothetical protein
MQTRNLNDLLAYLRAKEVQCYDTWSERKHGRLPATAAYELGQSHAFKLAADKLSRYLEDGE